MPDPVTRLELELLALGELGADRAEEIRAQAVQDAELGTWLERVAHEVEGARIDMPTLVLPPDPVATDTPLPAPANRPSAWRRLTPWLPLAAAALALAILVPGVWSLLPSGDPGGAPTITYRGSFDLSVTRVRLGQGETVGAWVKARAGDRLQFSITPSDDAWVMIYDLEEGGEVHTFLEPIQVASRQTHEAAVLLDDYEGSERIFVLVADSPVSREQVREAAFAAHRTPLPDLDALPGLDAVQRSIVVTKEDD